MWLTKSIIPECYIDSCLFNVILQFGKDGVNHGKGNGSVVEKIKKEFDNRFCVGIIDKDKRDLYFIELECRKIMGNDYEEYFKLYERNGNRHHYIIQIVPAVESWILKITNELNIQLSDYVSNAGTVRDLRVITKKISSKHDIRFVKLFKEIVSKSESIGYQPILKMKGVISYILNEQYRTDTKKLEEWLKK